MAIMHPKHTLCTFLCTALVAADERRLTAGQRYASTQFASMYLTNAVRLTSKDDVNADTERWCKAHLFMLYYPALF
jgi:hypothetical protein